MVHVRSRPGGHTSLMKVFLGQRNLLSHLISHGLWGRKRREGPLDRKYVVVIGERG